MDISVVVCTYNRASTLRRMLGSLRRMSVPEGLEWELIVVDNNSSDNTRQIVEKFRTRSHLGVRYVFEPKPGVSYARNAGVRNAGGEIVAFADDDVLVGRNWLMEVVHTFQEFNCAGMAGRAIPLWGKVPKPRWLNTTGRLRLGASIIMNIEFGPEAKQILSPPSTLNAAFKKSMFKAHGLFNPDFGVFGSGGLLGEDLDFGKRLIDAGELIVYSPTAVVYHPVHRDRLTRAYFLSYYHRLGRTCARQYQSTPDAVRLFGVPRAYFRSLLGSCFRWLTTFRSADRFSYKAHIYLYLGRITEAWKLRGEVPSGSPQPPIPAERQLSQSQVRMVSIIGPEPATLNKGERIACSADFDANS